MITSVSGLENQDSLTVNVIGDGVVNRNDSAPYYYGDVVELTAVPADGWTFSSWSGDLTGSTNPDTITMDGNKTVTATFTQNQYTLTINIVGSGSVTKNPDQATYIHGTAVQLTANPADGWTFSSWSGDLTGSTNPDTITMDGNKTVTATFTDVVPPITVDDYDRLWHTSDFTINLTATDDLSGVQTTYYRINDGSNMSVQIDGQPFISVEGYNKLEYWSVDVAGNEEEHKIIPDVKLDKTNPTANAGADQAVDEDKPMTFDGSASFDNINITSYTWTFFDETLQTLTGVNPNYTFNTPGNYNVTLTITDAALNSATDTVVVTVLDITKPIANAGDDRVIHEGTQVTFNGSSSTDNVEIVSYIWTFVDVTQQTLLDANATYIFATPGVYTVTLNVSDAADNWDTDEVIITVLDVTMPVADAGPNQTIDEDTSMTFDGSASIDNVGITSYTWSFFDVTPQTLTGMNPTYTFNTPGNYPVTLTVTDAALNSATDTVVVTVLDITKPIANAGDDQVVHEDVTVVFNGSGSYDPEGGLITSYIWTFIDDTLQTLSGVNSTYIFEIPGIYNVTLTISDEQGNSATDIVTITVVDATWPAANAGLDQIVDEDTLVNFDGSASLDNVGITSYIWTFTDGTLQTIFGINSNYTFETPGVYTVTLNVSDAEGHHTTDTVAITVLDITPPIVDIGSYTSVVERVPVSFDASGSSDNVGIVSYLWDFGDGTVENSTISSVIRTYTNPGVYMVILTVMDGEGNDAQATISIVVNRDTDGDLIADLIDTDDDNDGMSDDWEILRGLDPFDPSDASLDIDGDGLSNLTEYQIGSDPNVYTSPSPFPLFVLLVVAIIGFIISLGILFWRKL